MRARLLALSIAAVTLIPSCESQPLTIQSVRRSPGQLAQASRVLQCNVEQNQDPSSESVRIRFYAVDEMSRKLQRFSGLAQRAGLVAVSSCEEAAAYVQAYDEYSAMNPDFEDYPEDPGATTDQALGANGILPHLKVTNGQRDTEYDWEKGKPSPIVMIMPVFWWNNSMADALTATVYQKDINGNFIVDPKTGQYVRVSGLVNEFCEPFSTCTATFLDKYHLLTAAHCMQDTRLKSVVPDKTNPPVVASCPITGMPQNPDALAKENKGGYASWLILWSATTTAEEAEEKQGGQQYYTYGSFPYNRDNPGKYMPMPMLGVTAYQHPHPKYEKQAAKNHFDLAILSFDPSQAPEAYLPPDISRQGGTVYLKAGGKDPTSSENESFLVAGYGRVSGGTGIVNQLSWTKAPKDLQWFYGTYNDVASGTRVDDDDGHGATCVGDSGGPLYKNVKAVGQPAKVVQYGVTSFALNPEQDPENPNFGCPKPNTRVQFMRLEGLDNKSGKNEALDFINKELSYGVMVDGTTKMKTQCKPATINSNVRDVLQCWGEPCGGPEHIACKDPKTTCVGSGDSLPRNTKCHVCLDGTCNCILGQCMEYSN